MELAFAIISIILSLPALFLSIYAIVCLKAKEIADEVIRRAYNETRDAEAADEFYKPNREAAQNMYNFDDKNDEYLDEEGI